MKVIDWNRIPKGTKVQVSNSIVKEWKDRYFYKYNEENKDFPFEASQFIEDDFYLNWRYCKIHPSIVILDEWCKYVE